MGVGPRPVGHRHRLPHVPARRRDSRLGLGRAVADGTPASPRRYHARDAERTRQRRRGTSPSTGKPSRPRRPAGALRLGVARARAATATARRHLAGRARGDFGDEPNDLNSLYRRAGVARSRAAPDALVAQAGPRPAGDGARLGRRPAPQRRSRAQPPVLRRRVVAPGPLRAVGGRPRRASGRASSCPLWARARKPSSRSPGRRRGRR